MTNKVAVGSIDWITSENNNYEELLQREREEIVFPAQHELEWLNEHMNEIFSKSHVDVANVFKTPGKLRGKTPHTARKRNVEARIPLSDVFQSKRELMLNSNKGSRLPNLTATDRTAIDSRLKAQADSGYHGSSQIENVADKSPKTSTKSQTPHDDTLLSEMPTTMGTTEGSFHSAREDQTAKVEVHMGPGLSRDLPPILPTIDHEMQDVELPNFADIGSPSDQSTPERPAIRKKSSMTFASLPAREPVKASIGVRTSRSSHLGSGKNGSPALTPQGNIHDEVGNDDSNIEVLGRDDSDAESQLAKTHSRISTQRLHERIGALGKAAPVQPTKSMVFASAVTASMDGDAADEHHDNDEDEEEWIQPLSNGHQCTNSDTEDEDEFDIRAPELIAHEERMRQYSPSPIRPALGHTKSASTATLASPSRSVMAPPVSPVKSISMSNPVIPTTTPQGSPSRFLDGVSASKSKLQSIMKTAKGLFTSSASLSAAAKMETVTSKVDRVVSDKASILDKPLPMSPVRGDRQTRSSTERQKKHVKDTDVLQKMEEQLTKVREKEMLKAKAPSPHKNEERLAAKPTRPIHLGREVVKTKPQPVSIKVGTMSQRMPSTLTSGANETLPAEPKRPGLTAKASSSSLQSSAPTFISKTAQISQPSKPRALVAAERKKEQDLREAQRKIEIKRETERKRAAQLDAVRKREQDERAEAERHERDRLAQERAKRQAQQQAIERKRLEASRKAEQQRLDREGTNLPQKQAGFPDAASQSRPPSRMGQQVNRPLVNHQLPTNPAKPAKRPVEEETIRPQATKFGVASQQADAKRRRTEDEAESISRPTMSGAPIRQSQLGKKPSIFNHPAYQQVPMGQFPQPPRNHPMAQYATAKIPFAETVAVPVKTPASAYPQRTIQAIRSSPQYQNGDSIHLPEIPTDSEDEDSEDEGNSFPVPDWATPGHLTEQLIRQEGMDGDAVFGPIAPLKIEEIFAKGNKERLKRLRDRTSSANWAISGDGLTLEEVRADREQREKMRLEGGWKYGA